MTFLARQATEIYVTYVEGEGPLLKLWAQLERTQAILVERLILQLSEQFERGFGIPHAVHLGQVCCARYNDGVYYRARVTNLNEKSIGRIGVHFIDYGNSELVSLSDMRSIDDLPSNLNKLVTINEQATDFFLAGVIPITGTWDEASLSYIRQSLCYEELKCFPLSNHEKKKLVQVFYNNEDFAKVLISRHIGANISLQSQNILLHGYYGLNTIPPQFPGFNVPPPPKLMMNVVPTPSQQIPSIETVRIRPLQQNPETVVKETVKVFTSPMLDINSEHMVYVSHVEDGPVSFAVQQQSTEETLSSFMHEINNIPTVPVKQSLMPGSVCLGRFTEDQSLCRAVVMAVLDDKCRLYYVDFGNSEILPYSEIYELPHPFLNQQVMALRFTLAGLKNLTVTADIKSYFKEIVTEKLLLMRVVSPEGPPLKQYGELFLDGRNVLDLLIQKMKEKQIVPYETQPLPQVGTSESVRVSFVQNLSCFYVQVELYAEALKSVMLAIDTTCSSTSLPMQISQLKIGLPCCACYSEDGKWYRAKIMSLSKDTIEVMYVDYGNTDTVPVTSLKCIQSDLVKILKTQAILCCLKGYQDNTDDQLAIKFEELTLEKSLTMVVVDILQNNCILVDLFDSSTQTNIGLQLAPNKLPLIIPDSSKMIQQTQDLTKPNSVMEENDWSEPTEVNSYETQQNNFKMQYSKGGNKERYNSRGPNNHDENSNDWRKPNDERDGTSNKPWQKRESNKWKQDEDDTSGRRWGNRSDSDRGGGSKKWNSRDNDNRGGRSWHNDGSGSGYDNGGDFKKKSWNRDGDGFQLSNRWNSDEGTENKKRNNSEGGFERRNRWKNDGDGGGGSGNGAGRRNKWRNDNEDYNQNGGESDRWKNSRGKDGSRESRGYNKSWDNREQSTNRGQQKPNHVEISSTEKWEETAKPADEWNTKIMLDTWDDKTPAAITTGFPKASIQIGDVKSVHIVYSKNPWEFYIQDTSDCTKLKSVMDEIAAAYGDGSGNPEKVLQKGRSCVARYSEDGTFYRAIIDSVGTDDAGVFYCDYGNSEVLPFCDIKEIASQFIHLPIQGIKCSLSGTNPQSNSNHWTDEELNDFSNMTEGRKLQAHIVSEKDGIFEIVLLDIEAGYNINERLGASAAHVKESLQQVSKTVTKPSINTEVSDVATPDQRYSVQTVIPGSRNEVQLTWFINPKQFYCQLVSSVSELKEMMNLIQSGYSKKHLLNSSVQVGSPVIAKFVTDSVLYRAEVLDIHPTSLTVEFVDFGNCDIVEKCDVWDIETRFMTLPKQALHCSLDGVKPLEAEWPSGNKDIQSCFESDTFQCTFQSSDDNNINNVSLYLNGKNVAEELTNLGLAVPDQTTSQTSLNIEEEIIDITLLPGQILTTHITYVEGVHKFFIHPNPPQANKIQAAIDEYVTNPENMQPIESDSIKPGNLCIASPDSVQWYRGKLIDCKTTAGVYIKFIDFGDGDEIPIDKVLTIPPALTQVTEQAVECSLIVDGTTVSSQTEDQFKSDYEDTDVIIYIDSFDNGRLYVHIFDIEGKAIELQGITKGPFTMVDSVCPFPVISRKFQVWLPHIDGPHSMWLQRVSDGDIESELLEKLCTFYETEGNDCKLEVCEGKLCAAKSSWDFQWYRSRVVSVNAEEQLCTVHFIDYGNSETIPIANVRALDSSFSTPHTLAMCISLPVKFDSEEDVSNKLRELTADKQFYTLFGVKKENKWVIDLFEDDISISKKLLDCGVVKELESYSELTETSPSEKLKKGSSFSAFITHVDSPCQFWVQKAEDVDKIMSLQYELQMVSEELEAVQESQVVGTNCIALFSEEWYRATVIESDSTSVTLHFIDYGNVDIIDVTSGMIKSLPDKFQFPGYAIKCSLSNDSSHKFTEGATMKLEEIVNDGMSVTLLILGIDKDIVYADLNLPNSSSLLEILFSENLVTKEKNDNYNIKNIFVSHVVSPSEFWIQNESDSDKIESIENKMLEAENFEVINSCSEGELCAAIFTDGQWYRSKVLKENEGEFEVLYVDYGNSSTSLELRQLPKDLKDIPPLAKLCALCLPHNIKEWSETATDKFLEKVKQNIEFQVEIIEEGNCTYVSLIDKGQKIEAELALLCENSVEAIEKISVEQVELISNISVIEHTLLLAYVCHAISPCEFWIQLDELTLQLQEITDMLEESESFPVLNDFEENTLCVAQFPEDGNWYRAKILAYAEEGSEVTYIDFGNSSISFEFRELPVDFKSIPPIAKKCCLHVPNEKCQWSETVIEEFMEVIADSSKLFEMEIIKYDGETAVVSIWEEGRRIEDNLLKMYEHNKNQCENSSEIDHSNTNNVSKLTEEGKNILAEQDNITELPVGNILDTNKKNENVDINTDEFTEQNQDNDKDYADKGNLTTATEIVYTNTSDVKLTERVSNADFVSHSEISQEIEEIENSLNIPDLDEQVSNADLVSHIEVSQEIEEIENSLNISDVDEQVSNAGLVSHIEVSQEIEEIENSLTTNLIQKTNISHQLSEETKTNPETVANNNEFKESNDQTELDESLNNKKTEHTEKLVKEISVEMKISDSEVQHTKISPKVSYSDKIIPGSVSRGLSEEELHNTYQEPVSLKLSHSEKIVPGSISGLSMFNKNGDTTQSAPTTPILSRSERVLQRRLSVDNIKQSNPKLRHNERLVPGCISRGESKEEIYDSLPKLSHSDKIVPGSISRGASNDEKLLSELVPEINDNTVLSDTSKLIEETLSVKD